MDATQDIESQPEIPDSPLRDSELFPESIGISSEISETTSVSSDSFSEFIETSPEDSELNLEVSPEAPEINSDISELSVEARKLRAGISEMVLETVPDAKQQEPTEWFAIKTRLDFKAEEFLKPKCEEVFFPKETVMTQTKHKRERAIIPRVLFIKTTEANAIQLERAGRAHPELSVPFWIYRYPTDNRIQVIPESSIRLLKLLTANDTTRCEVFTKKDFRENQKVKVTGGPFKGYEGYVQRVRKNKHVVVKIEGICLVLLPFIHPDLLQPLEE